MARPVRPDVPPPKMAVQVEMNVKVVDAIDRAALDAKQRHPKRKHFSRAAVLHAVMLDTDLEKIVAKLSEGK